MRIYYFDKGAEGEESDYRVYKNFEEAYEAWIDAASDFIEFFKSSSRRERELMIRCRAALYSLKSITIEEYIEGVRSYNWEFVDEDLHEKVNESPETKNDISTLILEFMNSRDFEITYHTPYILSENINPFCDVYTVEVYDENYFKNFPETYHFSLIDAIKTICANYKNGVRYIVEGRDLYLGFHKMAHSKFDEIYTEEVVDVVLCELDDCKQEWLSTFSSDIVQGVACEIVRNFSTHVENMWFS